MGLLRALGFAVVTVPAVTVAHGAVSGALPAPLLLGLVAVTALVAGLLTRDAGPRSTALALVGAQLIGHGILYFAPGGSTSGCLPAIGRGARAGLDLALLRPAAHCGLDGVTAGVGAFAAVAVVGLALTLVVGQLLVAAAGAGALHVIEASWAAVQALAARFTPTLVEPVPLTPRPAPSPQPLLLPLLASPASRPLLRRGHPAGFAA